MHRMREELELGLVLLSSNVYSHFLLFTGFQAVSIKLALIKDWLHSFIGTEHCALSLVQNSFLVGQKKSKKDKGLQ